MISVRNLFFEQKLVSDELEKALYTQNFFRSLGKPKEREDSRKQLIVFAETIKQLASFSSDISREELLKHPLKPEIFNIYFNEEQRFANEKISEIYIQIMEDCSASGASPIKKSSLGQNGPTFLIDFPISSTNDSSTYCSFVLKWTNICEIVSQHIYKIFASEFSEEIFSVPTTAVINFEKQKFIDPSGIASSLEEPEKLQHILNGIVFSMGEKVKREKKIVFTEKIQGCDLNSFISSEKYSQLSEAHKQHLFYLFGMLSLLDLIMGNLERILAFEVDEKKLSNEIAANLGNILIATPENGKPQVWAIDNGISLHLISCQEPRFKQAIDDVQKEYNKILVDLISSEEGYLKLAENLLISLKVATVDLIEEKGQKKRKENLEIFLNDLASEEISKKKLLEGIKKMHQLVRECILPFWKGQNSSELKKYIQDQYFAILEPLIKRLNLFESSAME